MENKKGKKETLTGVYSYVANPCTTEPCLPGMVYAIMVDNECYYLTVNGHFFSENRSWKDYMPKPNEIVTVEGFLQERMDVFGDTYRIIKVLLVKPEK